MLLQISTLRGFLTIMVSICSMVVWIKLKSFIFCILYKDLAKNIVLDVLQGLNNRLNFVEKIVFSSIAKLGLTTI